MRRKKKKKEEKQLLAEESREKVLLKIGRGLGGNNSAGEGNNGQTLNQGGSGQAASMPASPSREPAHRSLGEGGEPFVEGFSPRSLLMQGSRVIDNAVKSYLRWVKLTREDAATIYLKKADSYELAGEYTKAIDVLKKLAELRPTEARVPYRIGLCQEKLEMYEEAVNSYQTALDLDSDYADCWFRLGMIYSLAESYDKAIEHLEKAVNLQPQHAEPWHRLGIAYDNKKQYDKAVKAFKKVIEINPLFPHIYKSLGFTYDSMGKHEEALVYFKKAIERQEL